MLNIKVQCCAMVILLVVSLFYFRLPRMAVATKREFTKLLIMSDVCVVADILSVFAIYYHNALPEKVVLFACKLYLMLMIFVIFQKLMYINADIYKNEKQFMYNRFAYAIIFIITSILLVIFPIDYVCLQSGNVVYSKGPSTTLCYAFFGFIYLVIILTLFKNRARINRRRRTAVLIWLVIWLLSAAIQLFDAKLLLVSFGGGFGVLIVFFMIENPEFGLDSDSGFYNIYAMTQYIDELYANDRKFSILLTSFSRLDSEFYMHMDSPHIFVGGAEIYMLFTDEGKCDNAVNAILERFFGQAVYVIRDSSMAESHEELFALFKGAQKIANLSDDKISTVYDIDDRLKNRLEDHKKAELLIKEALDEDRVEVFYQPIFDIEKEQFRGAEALVRIRDRDGCLVPPVVFIPVAEEEGSIISLGKIVFEKVCRFLSRDDIDGSGVHYIEVNLSVVQGADRHLATDIKSIMEKYRVDSDKINLEITESGSISSKHQLLKTMETLCEYGVGFSLDDFGTGQSNLDYMANMPVQLVKFDRSMIQDYFKSDKAKNIMDSCISMIHNLGLKIVAEGVETKDQYECMKAQGVDFIQGFYFSKPLPEDEYLAFMKEHNSLV